ncbi:MAG: HAMP domain-containing histidine kinase [Eubacterium sp.]|nr:HAMP domain-containing histidine kinase [Eubacterium sp.]
MKELRRKVFFTIFIILTLFNCISLVIINIVSYRREYESITQNLNIMDDRGDWMMPGRRWGEGPGGGMPEMLERPEDFEGPDMENMMFMDHEVYTVELNENGIVWIMNNGRVDSDFNPVTAATDILSSCEGDTIKIGSLYTGGYSFRYQPSRSIIIINKDKVSEKLVKLLIETIALFIALELVIMLISKLVTGWTTKPAREAFDRQKEFIADASHELKTPLAVIMASSDELSSDESNRRYVDNIKYESDRMNKLITGLLDLSKLEEGISKESYKEENLSKIVDKTCLVFEGVAFEEGVGIETDIESGISLKCSKEEMEKLVSTLLDNAVKHSDKGTSVETKLYRSKGSVILKIINTGEPIKEGDEERIFQRFYRADKSRNRSENRYGLGLAIAKRIVENHNGNIRAYSEEGKTVFRVEFK